MTKYDMSKVRVDIIGPPCIKGSQSTLVRSYTKMLLDYVDLKLPMIGAANDKSIVSEADQDMLTKLMPMTNQMPDIALRFDHPCLYKKLQIKQIGHVAWGTSKLPSQKLFAPQSGLEPDDFHWPNKMNLMDAVIAPSRFDVEVFNTSGVKVPVVNIGGPIDTDVFQKREVKGKGFVGVTHNPNGSIIPRNERRFIIGMVAEMNKRKDIEAFLRTAMVATPIKDAMIVLKTYSSAPNITADKIHSKIIALKQAMKLKDVPPIVVITDTLTDEGMADFYNCLDLYVCTSRGEGAGLSLMEAMACECLVIASGCTSSTEYVNQNNGVLLPVLHEVCSYEEDPLCATSIWYQGDMLWSKVSELDLIKTIHGVYTKWKTNRLSDPAVEAMRKAARDKIVKEYSFDVTRQRVLKCFRKVLGDSS